MCVDLIFVVFVNVGIERDKFLMVTFKLTIPFVLFIRENIDEGTVLVEPIFGLSQGFISLRTQILPICLRGVSFDCNELWSVIVLLRL